MPKYYVEDESYVIEVEAPNEAAAQWHAVEKELLIPPLLVTPAKGHHICKYCGSIADHEDEDILCADCRQMFGHAFYSEL